MDSWFTITPCHERVDLVLRLLQSLQVARAEAGEMDIHFIIIDSTPIDTEAASQIKEACQRIGADYLRGPESVRTKRNQAARYAIAKNASVVFFTDSDCEVTTTIFREHQQAYNLLVSPFTHRPVGATIGVTRFIGEQKVAFRAVARTPFLDSFRFAEAMPEAPFAPCTNFSIRADVFTAVNGFTEDWKYRLGGDDTELGRRINNAGYAIVSRPQAIVNHNTSTWNRWSTVVERAWRWGRMDILVRMMEPPANLHWMSPMPLQFALLLLPIAALVGWKSLLLLFAGVLLVCPVLTAVFRAGNPKEWSAFIGAEFLQLLFHLGGMLEAFSRGRPFLNNKEIITHPMQIGTSWESRRRSSWMTICLIIFWAVITWLLYRK